MRCFVKYMDLEVIGSAVIIFTLYFFPTEIKGKKAQFQAQDCLHFLGPEKSRQCLYTIQVGREELFVIWSPCIRLWPWVILKTTVYHKVRFISALDGYGCTWPQQWGKFIIHYYIIIILVKWIPTLLWDERQLAVFTEMASFRHRG